MYGTRIVCINGHPDIYVDKSTCVGETNEYIAIYRKAGLWMNKQIFHQYTDGQAYRIHIRVSESLWDIRTHAATER